MHEFDEYTEDINVPEVFRMIQQHLDSFVQVSYNTALAMEESITPSPETMPILKGKIQDIIRNNPPLKSVPKYYKDGREDYLWYSDFYDDISKEDYVRYRKFSQFINKITPASYAGELANIDLPYFKELVNLICLERLCLHYKDRVSQRVYKENTNELQLSAKEQEVQPVSIIEPKRTYISQKRSYEPKLTAEQYSILITCIEKIQLFRRPVKVTELKKLLKGKLPDPLQVSNQKSLVYLFDRLKENHYIKEAWVAVAEGNKDFISFRTAGNEQRYGNKPHYITMQQFLNNRARNEKEAVRGLVEIDEMIELMNENRDN